jgi:hypothetical protein
VTAAAQEKIGSGFGARSTAREVLDGIDLTGRLALVTGGYSGLGLETTRALAGAGARVVVPARRGPRRRTRWPGWRAWRSTSWTWATSTRWPRSPTGSWTRTARSTS